MANPMPTAMAVSSMCWTNRERMVPDWEEIQLHWSSGPAEPTSAICMRPYLSCTDSSVRQSYAAKVMTAFFGRLQRPGALRPGR